MITKLQKNQRTYFTFLSSNQSLLHITHSRHSQCLEKPRYLSVGRTPNLDEQLIPIKEWNVTSVYQRRCYISVRKENICKACAWATFTDTSSTWTLVEICLIRLYIGTCYNEICLQIYCSSGLYLHMGIFTNGILLYKQHIHNILLGKPTNCWLFIFWDTPSLTART